MLCIYFALTFGKDPHTLMKETHRSPLKLILGIVTVFLLLLLLGAGILYLKIQEPAKRSADFARLQQEAYQGVFFSMCAPESFPEDIYLPADIFSPAWTCIPRRSPVCPDSHCSYPATHSDRYSHPVPRRGTWVWHRSWSYGV